MTSPASLLFRGTGTALVTPFDADGRLDEAALDRLVDRQLAAAVEAIVILGTTGESPTVTDPERRRIVDRTLERVEGRVPVIVGTGTNDTAACVRHSREAEQAGADALLVVGPYYNKPSPAGLLAHFAAVAEATDVPIILYNVPGRTGSNITAGTTLRIAEEIPSVVGVKEASGNLAQIADLLRGRPHRLAVYSGDDELTLPLTALGGDGVISVLSNVLPGAFGGLVRLMLERDFGAARVGHLEMLEAMRACFYESNPGPVKAVLADAGLIEPTLRLPLAPVEPATLERLRTAFAPWTEHLQP